MLLSGVRDSTSKASKETRHQMQITDIYRQITNIYRQITDIYQQITDIYWKITDIYHKGVQLTESETERGGGEG